MNNRDTLCASVLTEIERLARADPDGNPLTFDDVRFALVDAMADALDFIEEAQRQHVEFMETIT